MRGHHAYKDLFSESKKMPKTGTRCGINGGKWTLYMSDGCRTLGQPKGNGNLSIPSTETAKQSSIMKHEGLSYPKEPERKKSKLK